MKKFVIGAAVAGAAVLACRKMHGRCREMFARGQESNLGGPCGSGSCSAAGDA